VSIDQRVPGSVEVTEYEVVLVSYHSRGEVAELLEAARPDQRLVVVDNASGVDGVHDEVGRFPHGRWLDGSDSGFAAGANAGARSSDAEFVVFANPDSRPTPAIWEALVADLKSDPILACVAAATVDPSGHIEIGVGGWEPTPSRAIVHATGLHRLFTHAGIYARPAHREDVALGWLTGACLAVRREVFIELGGFDERYFVYNEDMAFGRQVRQAGLRQRLRTDLLVPHATGGSGGGGTAMPQQRGASMGAYLRDHNGPVATAVMRTALGVGMLPRVVLAFTRGHRQIARQHLAYIRGIATGRSPYRP